MKKLISALLVVVMLISVVPFSNAAKTALGLTQASALETVDGSYDYLVNYIMANCDIQEDGSYGIVEITKSDNLTEYFGIGYFAKAETISCYYFTEQEDNWGQLFLDIQKAGDEYLFECGIGVEYASVIGTAKIDPETYNKENLDFEMDFSVSQLASLTDSFNETFNKILAEFIVKIDSYLKANVGISLGNFGFTKISTAQSLPQPSDKNVKMGDFSLKYKQSAIVRPIITPENKNVSHVEYSTSDPSVVSVDQNGNVTATGSGTATITCKVVDVFGYEYVFDYDVTVSYSFFQWIIRILLLGFLWY